MREQNFPAAFDGDAWVRGSRRPPVVCEGLPEYFDTRAANEIVYGRLEHDDYFLIWEGELIRYDGGPPPAIASAHSRDATHFVYSKRRHFGFVFRHAGGRWRLLGIDTLAPSC